MKKIGITTFHRSHNCGSILQSYAMQQVLKEYGHLPEFIDFSTLAQKKLYSVLRPLSFESSRKFARSMYRNLLGAALYNRAQQNWVSYNTYISRYLNVSKKSYDNNLELVDEVMNYDLYLTGSDQVWNITIEDFDDAYFLNFVKNKPKIAYAVSQGAKNITSHTSETGKYKNMIKDFDYLSVREPNGQKWLKDGFNIHSELVLDPTLLLNKLDYEDAEEETVESFQNNKYIFVYATKISRDQERAIQNVAKKEGLEIVVWQSDTWLKKLGWLKGYILPKNQNPGKYLYLMKNAKYVFTASFHGLVFAAQYKKNFWVLQNDGMNHERDDRILSLLEKFNFTNRLLAEDGMYKELPKPVDYTDFDSILSVERANSFRFLDKALKRTRK
jgi:hypothetical protein